jgi:predicted SAM-dependent methyltransferase
MFIFNKIRNLMNIYRSMYCGVLVASIVLTHYAHSMESFTVINSASRRKNVGLFKKEDPKLEGILFGNWGSRPYEYAWASRIVPIQGKKVIDLGIGIPSQYNWYAYVVQNLKPSFYAGVDCDGRILKELITEENYEIKYMNMASLDYGNQEFDTAYCISTFEHIPFDIFMQSIKEAHRVLKDGGSLIITLDEEWSKDVAFSHGNSWNELERSLEKENLFRRDKRSFGLPEFLNLIKDYFVLAQEDAIVNTQSGTIVSSKDGFIYYDRKNADTSLLNSGLPINSCVSYALLKKK